MDDIVGRLESLFDRCPLGVQIIRASGESIYVNRAFRENFGATPPAGYNVFQDEIAQKNGALVLLKKAFQGECVHIPAVWLDLSEWKHVQVSGAVGAPIETDVVPLKNIKGEVTHLIAYTKKVPIERTILEEQNKSKKILLDTNSLYRQLIDHSEVVMYAKDLNSRILFGNAQFEKIFDLKPADYIGKTDRDFFPAEMAESLIRNDQEVIQKDTPKELREYVRHADNTVHHYVSVKFPLKDSNGTTQGVIGISTEITESLRMERELSVAKRMESLGLLASGMTHDFNNILSIVTMYAESLGDKLLVEQVSQKNAVQKILKAVEKAGTLIRQLRTFGRKQFVQADWIDLNAAIRGTAETLRAALGEKYLLQLNLAATLPPVFLEATQVDQILLNLCLNAKDAMPGSGHISISTQNVSLDSSVFNRRLNAPSGSYVQLTVQDNGSGMDANTLEKAFEPFFTTKGQGRGTGLGLASVFGIMWHAGGDICVESEKGKGTTFSLYFPNEK